MKVGLKFMGGITRMKKYISLIALLFIMSVVLVACGDDDDKKDSDENNSEEATEESQEEESESQNEDEEESDELHEVDKGAADGDWGDDELGLGIGDTATKSNNFVMAEITLDSVEKEEDEDDESYYGHYTILHMTVKNIGDEAAEFEDIFETTELSDGEIDDNVDGGEIWEPETIDESPGEIAPGEEVSGPLIFDVDEADEYKLYMDFGLESVSNKTTFEFNDDEIE